MHQEFLEKLSWASQFVLMVVALAAAVAAFMQLRTFKLLEMLRFLELKETRESRRIVIREIAKLKGKNWWEGESDDAKRLEAAASDVCASYDILARMIEFDLLERIFPKWGYGAFFCRYWAKSIVLTHEALGEFLRNRREDKPNQNPRAYMGFTGLAERIGPVD